MRLTDIDADSASTVFDDLQLAISPEDRGKPWTERQHLLNTTDIRPHSIRTRAEGRAIEFFQSGKAEASLTPRGWQITRMRPYTEMFRGEPRPYMEIRLEKVGGEDWDIEKQRDDHTFGKLTYESFYHVTPLENVSEIAAHGLLPRTSSRPDMHIYGPRIYLALNLEAAAKMQKLFEKYDRARGIERFYATLKVDARAVREPKRDQEFRLDGIYTMNPIPPEAITAL